jgi:hypothetical protein
VSEPPRRRRGYDGTTTGALIRNVRDAPAIVRRYWPWSLAAAIVTGGIAWWIAGDVIAGAVAAAVVFLSGFVAGWGLEPFLPPDRQVIRPLRG